jgi:hypothetical protein
LLNRRRFTASLLTSHAATLLRAQSAPPQRRVDAQGTPGAAAGFTGSSFKDLPEGSPGEASGNIGQAGPFPTSSLAQYPLSGRGTFRTEQMRAM